MSASIELSPLPVRSNYNRNGNHPNVGTRGLLHARTDMQNCQHFMQEEELPHVLIKGPRLGENPGHYPRPVHSDHAINVGCFRLPFSPPTLATSPEGLQRRIKEGTSQVHAGWDDQVEKMCKATKSRGGAPVPSHATAALDLAMQWLKGSSKQVGVLQQECWIGPKHLYALHAVPLLLVLVLCCRRNCLLQMSVWPSPPTT